MLVVTTENSWRHRNAFFATHVECEMGRETLLLPAAKPSGRLALWSLWKMEESEGGTQGPLNAHPGVTQASSTDTVELVT